MATKYSWPFLLVYRYASLVFEINIVCYIMSPIIIATSHRWPLYVLYTLSVRGRRWVHRVATRKYLPSRFNPDGGRTLFLWNFKRTIGVRAEEFLTLRELPWQQWQAVINPRRERWRMVERGEEEEETRTDRRTDRLILPRSPQQLLILSFSVSTSSPSSLALPSPSLARRCESSSLFSYEDSRRERDAASRGIRRGFHHYTSIVFSLPSFRVYLFPRMTSTFFLLSSSFIRD